jgi:hypothetical protein
MDNFYAVHAANIANAHITHPEAVMNPEVDRVSCIYTVYGDEITKEIVASSPHINHTTDKQYEHPVLWLEAERGRSYEEMVREAERSIKVGEDIVKLLLKSVNN